MGMTFQMLEKKKKENGQFSGQKRAETQLIFPWNAQHSPVPEQDTTVSNTGLKIKGKPEQFELFDQLLCVKTLWGDLGQKCSQLFWGLPSLHSESIVDMLLVSKSSYPLENQLVLFNGVYKAPAVQMQDRRSPPLPQFHSCPLSFVHRQSFPHMEPQSQPLPLFQVHSQAHMKSPSSFPPCRNTFHRQQNRAGSDILNVNQPWEHHVLQNYEDHVWGLVPECQQYHQAFYPSAPNFPIIRQSSQDFVPVSVTPDHFHLSNEPQENQEPHGPNCLILPQCFHSCNPGRLTVMEPHYKSVDTFPCNFKCASSQHLEHWVHTCNALRKRELRQAGSFYDSVSTKSQLRRDEAKNLGHILGKCSLHNPSMISKCYVLNSLRTASETRGWMCHSRIASGHEPLNVSRNLDQNQMKSILRLHVSRKFWQITMGRIPIKVCHSWLMEDNTMPPGNSHTSMEEKSLSPLLGRIYCHLPTLELSFLDHKTQQFLEAHIIRFRVSQKWGLPLRVLESIKLYMLREAKTWPFSPSDLPSSSVHVCGVDLKTAFPQPLRGSTHFFQEDKVETTNSVSVTDHPLPATSFVDIEGEGSLSRSQSDGDHEITEIVPKTEEGRQIFLPPTHSIIDQASQNNSVLEKKHSQEQSRKQDVAAPESGDETANSTHIIEIYEGSQNMKKDSEHFSTCNMSPEMLRTCEPCVPPSESDVTSKIGDSQMTNGNGNKVGSMLAPECDPPKISIPKDPTLSEFKRQLLTELRLRLESRFHSLAGDSASDTSLSSDSLTSESSLPSSNGEDVVAFQELHAHLDDTRIFTEPCVTWKCQDKNSTPGERRLVPTGPKREKGTNEGTGLQTPRATRKSDPAKKGKVDKEPSPPENYLKNKMRHLFQWLSSPRANEGHRSPEKDRALFMSCGPPEAHELMAALGKILEKKLECGQKLEFLGWREGKKTQAQPEHSSGAGYDPQQGEGSNPCFRSRTAFSPDQSHILSVAQSRNRITHPEKMWPSRKKRDSGVLSLSHLAGSTSHRSCLSKGVPSVSHCSHTCRRH